MDMIPPSAQITGDLLEVADSNPHLSSPLRELLRTAAGRIRSYEITMAAHPYDGDSVTIADAEALEAFLAAYVRRDTDCSGMLMQFTIAAMCLAAAIMKQRNG